MGNSRKIFSYQKKAKLARRGFAVTGLLLASLVLILCLTGFTALSFSIRNYNLAQTLCIEKTLALQNKMKHQLTMLLKLNTPAKTLRRMYNIISKLHREALKIGEPISISALYMKKKLLYHKRKILDRKQKNILRTSRRTADTAFNSFKKQLRTQLKAQSFKKTSHSPFPLAVKALSQKGPAPVYKIKAQFSKKQKLSFSWKMPLHHKIPEWIRNIFFTPQLSFYTCTATLKKKPGGLEPA